MPLTPKGTEVLAALVKEYGPVKGKQIFYTMINSGKLKGGESK